MASIEPPNESALTIAIRLVTSLMNEASEFQNQQNPEIDCGALQDMIESAQRLHVKYCPIANGPE